MIAHSTVPVMTAGSAVASEEMLIDGIIPGVRLLCVTWTHELADSSHCLCWQSPWVRSSWQPCGPVDPSMAFRSLAAIAVSVAVVFSLPGIPALAVDELASSVQCTFTDDRLTEISGLAVSLRDPKLVWLHNDSSDDARIYGIDTGSCETVAEVDIANVVARDVESISASRDRRGRPVLWVADIGDNRDSWADVGLYRIREPKGRGEVSLDAREFRFTYDDRPHNAETVLVDGERIWIATWQLATGGLYELTKRSRTAVTSASKVADVGSLITDGAIAPDRSGYVLRDYLDVHFFQGQPPGRKVATFALPRQPQGEAITWTLDGTGLLTASEDDDRLLRVDVPWWVRAAMRAPDHLVD